MTCRSDVLPLTLFKTKNNTSPFGSHVSEALISRVAALTDRAAANNSNAGGEGERGTADPSTEALSVLEAATQAAGEKLYDLLVDRCGSHVVRSLLAALAGRAVEPARIGRGGGPGGGGCDTSADDGSAVTDGAAFLRERARRASAPATSLASRGVSGSASFRTPFPLPPPPTRHAGLVRRLARVVLSRDWESDLGGLSYHPYAAPALQALLRAARGDDDLVCELVPRLLGAPPATSKSAEDKSEGDGGEEAPPPPLPAEGARLALLTKDAVAAAARDRAGSHLLEAVLETAPRSLRTEFDARFLRGGFAALAEHPCANFVVQAALGAADSPAAVRGAARELAPVAGRLLAGSRGGVLLALVGAAGRVGRAGGVGEEKEKEKAEKKKEGSNGASASTTTASAAAAAVAAAAEAVDAALDKAADRASALLVLGEKPIVSASAADVEKSKRLSAVGCALLSSLLSLPSRHAAAPYAAALAALPDAAFARVAADGAGSRAVEALFSGPGLGAKAKKAAGKKLAGRLAAVASTPGGVHAIERAFEAAGAGGREAVAAELAAAAREGTLSTGPPRVVALMRKCGVVEWQQRWREGGGGGGGKGRQQAPASPWKAPASAAALLGEEEEEEEEEKEDDDEEEKLEETKAPAPDPAVAEPAKLPRKRGGAKRAARAARAAAAIEEAREEQEERKRQKRQKEAEEET